MRKPKLSRAVRIIADLKQVEQELYEAL